MRLAWCLIVVGKKLVVNYHKWTARHRISLPPTTYPPICHHGFKTPKFSLFSTETPFFKKVRNVWRQHWRTSRPQPNRNRAPLQRLSKHENWTNQMKLELMNEIAISHRLSTCWIPRNHYLQRNALPWNTKHKNIGQKMFTETCVIFHRKVRIYAPGASSAKPSKCPHSKTIQLIKYG